MLIIKKLSSALLLLFLISCSRSQPAPINYGIDACDFCRMTIVDPKWGAEIITNKGKVYKFDVVECMVAFYYSRIDTNNVRSMWTIDFAYPGQFIEARNANYILTHQFPSPMGLNAISLKSYDDTVKIKLQGDYQKLKYWDVVNKVKSDILE